MSDNWQYPYTPGNLDYWIERKPLDVLISCCSDARKAAELQVDVAKNLNDPMATSTDNELIFDVDPPLKFNQLVSKLAYHSMAIIHLIVIGYRYWRPPEKRYWDAGEDFNIEINITDDFDAPAFALEHQQVPPLSMLCAISNAFVEHGTEADYYFRLIEEPEIMQRVHFYINNKNRPFSIFKDGFTDHNRYFILIGQTGIDYVNAKRKEIED